MILFKRFGFGKHRRLLVDPSGNPFNLWAKKDLPMEIQIIILPSADLAASNSLLKTHISKKSKGLFLNGMLKRDLFIQKFKIQCFFLN